MNLVTVSRLAFALVLVAIIALDGGINLTNLILIALFGGLFICAEVIIQKRDFKTILFVSFGLAFGYLLGLAFGALGLLFVGPKASVQAPLVLLGAYVGLMLALRAKNELSHKIVLDSSVLGDSRLFELATSGLLTQTLVIPKGMLQDLEKEDEASKRALEAIKKLGVRTVDGQDSAELAGRLGAYLLSCKDHSGVKVINLNCLAQTLRPQAAIGDTLRVKIQRVGKEPKQGIGYLEDSSMIVVNDGADWIGKTVMVKILLVKQTSAGRMIFCNLAEELVPC